MKEQANNPVPADVLTKNYLDELAKKVLSDISDHFPDRRDEMLRMFVMLLTSQHAERERKAHWRKKQAEGIQAAKARGTQFGRPPKPLPDSFYPAYQRWKAGEISSTKAAAECGMKEPSFRYRAVHFHDPQV